MWKITGYIVTVVINYFVLRKLKREDKDCPGCNYIHCDRHYGWGDVFMCICVALFGPVTTVFIVIITLITKLLKIKPKPPKWL